MEKAVKIAEENGYKTFSIIMTTEWKEDAYRWFVLDPEFWQALGKGLGYGTTDLWKSDWHNLINHLAEGKDLDKDINSFFENLCQV